MELLGSHMGVLWGSLGDLSVFLPPFELPFDVLGRILGLLGTLVGIPGGIGQPCVANLAQRKQTFKENRPSESVVNSNDIIDSLSNRGSSFLNQRGSCGYDRFSLHLPFSYASPTQSAPPFSGEGLSQARFLVLSASPHDTEHSLHSPQSAHPPSTSLRTK